MPEVSTPKSLPLATQGPAGPEGAIGGSGDRDANTFYAGPTTGAAAPPTFRNLTFIDLSAAGLLGTGASQVAFGNHSHSLFAQDTAGFASGPSAAAIAGAWPLRAGNAYSAIVWGDISALAGTSSTSFAAGNHSHSTFGVGVAGFMPAPSSDDVANNRIIRADGTWIDQPAGGGGGGGSVTSVGLVMPEDFEVAGSPITTGGNLTVTYGDQSAGTVFAAPASSTGAPTFQALTWQHVDHLAGSSSTTFAAGNHGHAISAITNLQSELDDRTTDTEFTSHTSATGNGTHIPSGGITNTNVATSAAIAWSKIDKSGATASDVGADPVGTAAAAAAALTFYNRMFDGVNTAAASSNNDVFKFRVQDGLSALVTSDDPTHNDNVLLGINDGGIGLVKIEDVPTNVVLGRFSTGSGPIEQFEFFNSGAFAGTASQTIVSKNYVDAEISGSQQNLYSSFTDGTNTATTSSATDTFKFRSGNAAIALTVGDDDATHGDNLLIDLSELQTANYADGSVTTAKIPDEAITLPKLQHFTQSTVLGRAVAGTGDPSLLELLNSGSPSTSAAEAIPTVNYVDTEIDTKRGLILLARSASTTRSTGSGTIPFDNTIPQQSTEGTQFLSVAATPSSASKILYVQVRAWLGEVPSGASGDSLVGALFVDSTEDAIAAGVLSSYTISGNYVSGLFELNYRVAAGSTTARTYKFRAGMASSGTAEFNGIAGAARFGGVMESSIEVWEGNN